MLTELLEREDVSEELQLRSRFGFMAYHGGTLEKATDTVAREAAANAGASYYGIVQHQEDPTHIASTSVSPAHSDRLAAFLDHVAVVVSVHGFGRDDRRRSVLLGGRNRSLAHHLAAYGRAALPSYSFHTALDEIPPELAGMHPRNPVNLPRSAGVQVELPPTVRWHYEARGWSDHHGVGRAPQLDALIASLASAALAWPIPPSSSCDRPRP
jgi:phage replication-related protein YjqB (UPF0714/DUF867 family)